MANDTDQDELEEQKGDDIPKDEDAEGEEGEGGGKKKSKKKLIIILLVVILLAGGGAGAYFMGFIGGGKSSPTSGDGSEGETQEGIYGGGGDGEEYVNEDGEIEQTIYYDLEEFIVNLNVGSKRPSFLKTKVSLELRGESQVPAIEEKMPRIRDSFQVYLRELRQEDLQGSAGMYRLREELLLRINKIVYPSKVNDILFKEILVQ